MLELFFDSCATVQIEFIPEGAAVIKHCYKEILRHLHISVPSFGAGRTGCSNTTTPFHSSQANQSAPWCYSEGCGDHPDTSFEDTNVKHKFTYIV
jgi:hypothetical protein